MKNLKKISIMLAILVATITISKSLLKLDTRWAKTKYVKTVESKVEVIETDVHFVELRLEQKILRDDLRQQQQRIWDLEDRYGSLDNMPPEVKNEYRNLKMDKEETQQEYDITKKKLRDRNTH